MRKTLSVSQITKLLFEPEFFFRKHRRFEFERGIEKHRELGYTNAVMFKRIYKGWLIYGTPDKLSGDLLEDLKTYSDFQLRQQLINEGILQCNIYCFLTGLKKFKLTLINIQTGETEEQIFDYNEQETFNKLDEVINKMLKLAEILNMKLID